MRPKSLALLLLALGCGLVASIGITRVLTKPPSEKDVAIAPGRGIYVAATDIGMGDLLTPQMLKQREWPKDKTPAGAISDMKELEGRRTRARLYVGEPILENRLFAKGTSQQGASAMITKGYRIVPVKVDLVSGGSSLILPGDRVDVMVYLVEDPRRGIKETVTRTILQDVKVFAVNDVLDMQSEKDGGKSIAAKTISLLVTPKQASIVMLATQMGVVNLVMRSPENEAESENAEARPGDLWGEVTKPDQKPAKDEPKIEPNMPAAVVPAPVVDMPKPRPTWTIRVLTPNAVESVTLEQEMTADPASPLWKPISATNSQPPDAQPSNAAPNVVEPPVSQGEPEPTTQEPISKE